ncbi:MAG: DUF4395 domain-containing protein [Sulfurovum sp.]|nr:MAG: DUF4395 domain-containing protein [Sulfurovum sp.]
MSPSCPISTRRVDTNMMRIISFQVVIFTLALIFTQEKLFALILLFDFSVRALRMTGLSPFHTVGKFMLNRWGAEPKMCDESPKRFALYLGLMTSFFLSLFYIGGTVEIATFIAIILLTCALLETLFDFCIGCKIYYAIQLLKAFKNDRNLY